MGATNTGAAREVGAGRLTNFEDADGPVLTPPTMGLPPRRPRRPTIDLDAAARVGEGDDSGEGITITQTPPVTDVHEQPAGTGQGPRRDRATRGPEDKVRASNTHIPVVLLEPLTRRCQSEGLSHGEVIIYAIETAHADLPDLIHPPTTTGGSLFASRRSRASRATDGPLTPLNYRLREGDFATLDALVDEFGASSRGHLITVSLLHLFRDELST